MFGLTSASRYPWWDRVEGASLLTEWIRLLSGAVLFGAAIVVTMVASRYAHLPGVIFSIAALATAVAGFGTVVASYGTTESVALAIFFLFAGIVGGYWIAAAALPLLAHTERDESLPVPRNELPANERVAVIVLATAEPEHYDPRAIALDHRHLVESGALSVPATAAPFIFLSEKARYRAIGGRLPARTIAEAIAKRLHEVLQRDGRITSVRIAWCASRPSLADRLRSAWSEGVGRVVVVPLGSDVSFPVSLARRSVEALRTDAHGMSVSFAPSLWHSNRLARRLCERIISVTRGVTKEAIGVVLVAEGQPPSWTAMHPGWSEQENYFAQRVRLHLADIGIIERHVRVGWLEWQMPDVTETVRHLAALGCTRIIVAPGLIPLPSLATEIDLEHAIRMARLSEAVSVVTLAPWGEDDTVVEVLAEGVRSTLGDA